MRAIGFKQTTLAVLVLAAAPAWGDGTLGLGEVLRLSRKRRS
jgi:hypothetical protein